MNLGAAFTRLLSSSIREKQRCQSLNWLILKHGMRKHTVLYTFPSASTHRLHPAVDSGVTEMMQWVNYTCHLIHVCVCFVFLSALCLTTQRCWALLVGEGLAAGLHVIIICWSLTYASSLLFESRTLESHCFSASEPKACQYS